MKSNLLLDMNEHSRDCSVFLKTAKYCIRYLDFNEKYILDNGRIRSINLTLEIVLPLINFKAKYVLFLFYFDGYIQYWLRISRTYLNGHLKR